MDTHEVIKEIENVYKLRSNFYQGISVKAAIVKEDGSWRNLVTLVMPLNSNAGSERELDYGDLVILETKISSEEFLTFVSDLSKGKTLNIGNYKIDLAEGDMFSEFAFSFPWGDNFISALGSGDIQRFGLRWPSKGFIIGSTQHKGLPNIPFARWIRKGLPAYQSVLSAIENEFPVPGFTSTPYYLGRTIFLLPDYRARFTKIDIRRDSVVVHLEVSSEFKEKLFIKYMNHIPLNEEHPSDELPVTSDSIVIQLNGPPSSLYCYLLNESLEVLDIIRYDENYGYFNRDWIVYEDGGERVDYLTSLGESQTLEYKRDLGGNDRFLRAVVAFSNTNDGTILIGVDDDGTIIGCDDITMEQIEQSIRDKIQPFVKTEIELVKHNDKPIIIVRVNEGTEKPYFLKAGSSLTPYVRRNASDVAMRYDEIEDIYRHKFANGNVIRYG